MSIHNGIDNPNWTFERQKELQQIAETAIRDYLRYRAINESITNIGDFIDVLAATVYCAPQIADCDGDSTDDEIAIVIDTESDKTFRLVITEI